MPPNNIPPLRRGVSARVHKPEEEKSQPLTRAQSLQQSKAKPLPTLPPASLLDMLDRPKPGMVTPVTKKYYSETFMRRLDRAAAITSTPNRVVTPLGILHEFTKSGVELRGKYGTQARISDAELKKRGIAAYDSSLPKPRSHDPQLHSPRPDDIMLTVVKWSDADVSLG